ncbi:hypothetical protein F4781DRAFT_58862 [Annulohypoxylon bovei var. microspora]|nr:hypothetical protein F4781DRAFT_58862 [Annulohypoxylon bovei var. microspora]
MWMYGCRYGCRYGCSAILPRLLGRYICRAIGILNIWNINKDALGLWKSEWSNWRICMQFAAGIRNGIGLLRRKRQFERSHRPAPTGMTTALAAGWAGLECSFFLVALAKQLTKTQWWCEIGRNPTRRDVDYVGTLVGWMSWQIRGLPLGSTGCRISCQTTPCLCKPMAHGFPSFDFSFFSGECGK